MESNNIDDLVKELESKMPKGKLNINLVKMKEEINSLIILSKDPRKMYDADLNYDEQFNTMQIDNSKPRLTTSSRASIAGIKPINIKFPILKEDARITIKRDKNLIIKAGGYDHEKALNELSAYSTYGLI